MQRIIVLAIIAFGLAQPSYAGNLFPPSNIGSNPVAACPYGQVLGWTGDGTACTNPALGVTLSCPSGQFLIGISRGAAICGTPPTVTAAAPPPPPVTIPVASPKESCSGAYGASALHGYKTTGWRVACARTHPCVAGVTRVSAVEVLCNDGKWVHTGRNIIKRCFACFVTKNP